MMTLEEATKEAAGLIKNLLEKGKDVMIVASAEAGICMMLGRIYDTPSNEVQDSIQREFRRITSH